MHLLRGYSRMIMMNVMPSHFFYGVCEQTQFYFYVSIITIICTLCCIIMHVVLYYYYLHVEIIHIVLVLLCTDP